MPDVPPPEDLEDEVELRKRFAKDLPPEYREMFTRERPIDVRPIEPNDFFNPTRRQPFQNGWMRARDALPDDQRLHQCVLAYLSDWSLLDTVADAARRVVHAAERPESRASITRCGSTGRFAPTSGCCSSQDSPSASGARGFNRGLIYRRDGALIASVAQEGLMRLREEPR